MNCNFIRTRGFGKNQIHEVCSWAGKVLFRSKNFEEAMAWLNANPG